MKNIFAISLFCYLTIPLFHLFTISSDFSQRLLKAEEFSGHSGADFLKFGAGARVSAMGEAGVALAGDVYATYWNPAGLAEVEQLQMGITHGEAIMNARTEFAALVYPTRIGGWGFSGNFFIPETIPVTDGTGEVLGEIKWLDYALSISYGRKISNHLSLGANFKMISRKESDPIFGGTKGRAYAGDFGAIGRVSENLNFGLALLNLGNKIHMQGEWRKDDLPRTVRVGFAYQIESQQIDVLLVAGDLSKMLNDKWQKNLGFEYNFGGNIFLRAGYLEKGGNIRGLTYGVGIKMGNYQFDFASVPAGEILGYTRSSRVSLLTQF